MTLDDIIRAVTAFESFDSLVAAVKGGYVPSLIVYGDNTPDEIAVKTTLTRVLRAKGYRVWQGCRATKVETLRRNYKVARAHCMAVKGRASRVRGSCYDYPGYDSARNRLFEARKALQRAERALKRTSPNNPVLPS